MVRITCQTEWSQLIAAIYTVRIDPAKVPETRHFRHEIFYFQSKALSLQSSKIILAKLNVSTGRIQKKAGDHCSMRASVSHLHLQVMIAFCLHIGRGLSSRPVK